MAFLSWLVLTHLTPAPESLHTPSMHIFDIRCATTALCCLIVDNARGKEHVLKACSNLRVCGSIPENQRILIFCHWLFLASRGRRFITYLFKTPVSQNIFISFFFLPTRFEIDRFNCITIYMPFMATTVLSLLVSEMMFV